MPGGVGGGGRNSPAYPILRPANTGQSPSLGELSHGRLIHRPVMESGRIEVSPIGPNESTDFRVNLDGGKESRVSEPSIEFPLKDRLKIDELRSAIIEADPQPITFESIH
jgi:hypothetical protein